MAHNLYENKIFYYGEKPWHGIGKELQKPATAKEAIIEAGLDYRIEHRDLYYPIPTHTAKAHGYKAVVNCENQAILGITGENYQIIQNVESFDFFDVVIGEGQAVYHTAGALGKGERVWILAKLPNDIVVKNDNIEKYLCLTNSHDGKNSLKLYFTPVRVVCQNTLNFSLKDAGQGISIRHTGNIKSKIDEARRILGLSINFYNQFETIVNQLADVELNVKQAETYFTKVLSIKEDEEVSTKTQNKLDTFLSLFERGLGNDEKSIRHTAWTAYNAVTEYVDHHGTIKNLADDKTNKLKNIWFGNGARLKEKAFDEAVQLINA